MSVLVVKDIDFLVVALRMVWAYLRLISMITGVPCKADKDVTTSEASMS